MWNFFSKSKSEHIHRWEKTGAFYKIIVTPYRNSLDTVQVIDVKRCVECNATEETIRCHRDFPPMITGHSSTSIDSYVDKLRTQGYVEEFEFKQ